MGHEHDDAPLTGDPSGSETRAAQGVEHLQAAAHEMIQAARAFLDVMEDLVGDEEKVASVAEAFGSIARGAARAAQTATHPKDAPNTGGDEGFDDGVQHIRVS